MDRASRIWASEAGGGALLDLAVYPFTWTLLALGSPATWTADAVVLPDVGVDVLTTLSLAYPGTAVAQRTCTPLSQAVHTGTMAGEDATLSTWAPLTNPTGGTIEVSEGVREVRADPTGPPHAFMLHEVTRCVQEGLLESPAMPLDLTLATIRMFDDVRRRIGVRCPNDARVR